jgi:hypothetical protein
MFFAFILILDITKLELVLSESEERICYDISPYYSDKLRMEWSTGRNGVL